MRKNNLIYYFLIIFIIASCSGNKSSSVESKNDSISIIQTEKVSIETSKIVEEKRIVPVKTKLRPKITPKVRPIVYTSDSKDNENPTPKVIYPAVDIKFDTVLTKVVSVKKSIIQKDTVDVEVKIGTLVYHVPDTMISKKTYIIKIRINRDTSDNKIVENIEPNAVRVPIKTTSKMEVNIVDPSPDNNKSFVIVKSNDDTQLVDNDEYTEWIYGVTPLKGGKLKLNIVVSIIRNGNKKQIVYFIYMIEEGKSTAQLLTKSIKIK